MFVSVTQTSLYQRLKVSFQPILTYVCFCDANKYISTFEGKLSANIMFVSVTQTSIYTVFVSAITNKCMSTFEGKLSPITCFCNCKQVYIYCVCFCDCIQVYALCLFLRLQTSVCQRLKVRFHQYCLHFCDCKQMYMNI